MPGENAVEWLDELQKLSASTQEDNGFLTSREICERTGKSHDAVLQMLRVAARLGRLETCMKRIRRIDGRYCYVQAYRITPSKKKPR